MYMKRSTVGRKIKYYREERKFTQQELADKIGVTWEMISRYERGVSEPYGRIEAIAKALNTHVGELLQNNNNTNYSNQIPLFTKIPKNFNFDIEKTRYFYTCPLWILKKDRGVFALDMSIVKEEKEGIYYISPNTKPKKDSFILFLKENKLFVGKFQNQKNIIGTVLTIEEKTFH